MKRLEERRYPSCCTSYYFAKCGAECEGCPDKPVLDAFKQWVADTEAVERDPVWSPGFYVATK